MIRVARENEHTLKEKIYLFGIPMMEQEQVKRRGLLKKHAAIDYQVWKWKTSVEQSGRKHVTKTEIQAQALKVYQEAGVTNFKASDGWYRRWRVRWPKLEEVKSKKCSCEKKLISQGSTETPSGNKRSINNDLQKYSDNSEKSQTSNIVGNKTNTINKCNNKFKSSSYKLKSDTLNSYANDCTLSGNNNGIGDAKSKEAEARGINERTDTSSKNDSSVEENTKSSPQNLAPNTTEAVCNATNPGCSRSPDLGPSDNCNRESNETDSQTLGDNRVDVSTAPASKGGLKTFTHSLFDHRDLDYHDHNFLCELCEDLHSQKVNNAHICKEKEDILFLRCVSEKRDEKRDPTDILQTGKSSTDEISTKKPHTAKVGKHNPKNSSEVFTKGKRYLEQFKNKVVNYTLTHNAKQAAAVFKVNRGTISEWLNERKRSSDNATAQFKSVKAVRVADDSEFLAWLEGSKFIMTSELVKQKAEEWLQLEGGATSKCDWLRMYAYRLNGSEDKFTKKRYIAYSETFKRLVVFHAQTHSNMAAARVFGVARRRVVQWQQIYSKAGVKGTTPQTNVTDEVVDNKLIDWYTSQDPPPSSKQVRNKGLDLYHAAGYDSMQCSAQWYYRWRARHKLLPAGYTIDQEVPLLSWALTQLDNHQCVTHSALAQAYTDLHHFPVSRGWTFRFCKKYFQLLQLVPSPSTPLPSVLEQQVEGFLQALQGKVKEEGYKPSDVLAMDEIPVHFFPKGNSARPPLVRRPGFESCQASLVVSTLADGTLLPTMFVFKGEAPSTSSEPCVVAVKNNSGLVSEDVLAQWLTHICFPHLSGRGSLLVTDSYEVHTSEAMQKATSACRVHHAVTPGGCGFRLLPTNNLCQLFKSMLEELCQMCLASQTIGPSPASPDQLYTWAVRVHKHLAKHQKDNIKTAFREMLQLFVATD